MIYYMPFFVGCMRICSTLYHRIVTRWCRRVCVYSGDRLDSGDNEGRSELRFAV